MQVSYSTSWSFIGGNPNKRHNTVKVVKDKGKTISITQVKSFETLEEAEKHAKLLNGGK